MFTALEDEIVRILRANLSPAPVPADHVVNGPSGPPPAEERPRVAVTADRFEVLPSSDDGPPRGVKVAVEDVFLAGAGEPLTLSRPPREPLRAVEVEETPGGDRILLRPRDDYTVDYLNGQVRLRQEPAGTVHVLYFTLQPLTVLSATRLRVDARVEVWAEDAAIAATLATVAAGALAANAAAVDGLLSAGEEVPDSGLPSLGVRRVFFLFEALRPVAGRQSADGDDPDWTVDYAADATMVLVPRDETPGVIRFIAAGVAWDERLASLVLSRPPPILDRPVTDVLGVGPVTAATLADRGITTIGQLAQASATGETAIDAAIARARVIRERARQVVRTVVEAGPEIPDVAAFLAQPLDAVDAAGLTAIGLTPEAAEATVAAIEDLLAQTSAPDLTLADLFFR